MQDVVPVQAGAFGGLFAGNGLGLFALRDGVESLGVVPFDLAHREMRLVVVAGEDANPSSHSRRKASNRPRSLILARLLFTASHSPTLVLANAIPSLSWVGICRITASSRRSFTSQETTGKSLINAPMCPADR